jgi:hypothetical protein
MNEARIYGRLESLRDNYIADSLKPAIESDIKLDGQKFSQRVWSEPNDAGELIIFMLESRKIIVSKAFCLGLIIDENGATEKLSNEQLWEIGIP